MVDATKVVTVLVFAKVGEVERAPVANRTVPSSELAGQPSTCAKLETLERSEQLGLTDFMEHL